MTPNLYGGDVAEQSRGDYEYFAQEYNKTYESLRNVMQQIKLLQK